MSLTCPRCHSALLPDKHATGIAWRCHGCGGQSLNFSQFRRVIPEDHANDIWETAMLTPRAPSIRSLCPECQRDMAAVLVPLKDREVELDVCRSCQRVWLDRQERIAGHLRENAEPGPQPEVKPISPGTRVRAGRAWSKRVHHTFTDTDLQRARIVWLGIGVLVFLAILRFFAGRR